FRGLDIWSTAQVEKPGTSGWLGRYFDNSCSGADPGPSAPNATRSKAADKAQAEPSAAIALTGEPPTALQGNKFLPIAFRSPSNLNYGAANRDMTIKGAFEKLNDVDHKMDEMAPARAGSDTNDFLQRSA